MDDIARATLKTSNQAMVTAIDRSLESGIASKIILFDKSVHRVIGSSPGELVSRTDSYTKETKNYYF